jgi:hypothetical protein
MERQVAAIGGDIDDAIHASRASLARAGVEHPAQRIDADLARFHLAQARNGGVDDLERIVFVLCRSASFRPRCVQPRPSVRSV